MNNSSKPILSKEQKLVIASTATGFSFENMDFNFMSFALSSIIASLGISTVQAGWITTITQWGVLLGGLLFGLLSDKYGRIKIFSYTIFIFAAGTALMYFAHNITTIYILRFLIGLGNGGEYGVGMALIAEHFAAKQYGRVSSVAAIGGQLGSILAAVLSALILPRLGWHVLFLVGIFPVILAFFIRRNLKESDTFITNQQKEDKPKVSFKRLFSTPKLSMQTLGLICMVVVQAGGYFGLMNWLPTIVQKQLGISVRGSSLWMISTIIGMCIGMLVFGNILDRLGPQKSFGLFLFGAALVIYILVRARNMVELLILGAIVGFFANGMYGGYGAIINYLYPIDIVATANSFIMNIGKFIGSFSTVVIGFLMSKLSIEGVMAFLSIMYLVSFAIMMFLPGLKTMTKELRANK